MKTLEGMLSRKNNIIPQNEPVLPGPSGPDPKPLLNRFTPSPTPSPTGQSSIRSDNILTMRYQRDDDRVDEEGNLILLNATKLEESSTLPVLVAGTTFVVYLSLGLFLGLYLENWDLPATIYFIVATLTTVGYGDYTLSHESRLLGTVYVLVGVVFVGAAFGVIVDFLKNRGHYSPTPDEENPTDEFVSASDVERDLEAMWKNFKSCMLELVFVILFGASVFYWIELKYGDPDSYLPFNSALYWATVTVTTVGYGDVVPTCDLTRTFATVYICLAFLSVANTLFFLGSMPMELRKLKHQNRVLVQFGSSLDAEEFGALLDCPNLKWLRSPPMQQRRYVTRTEFAMWLLLQAKVLDRVWANKCFAIFDELDIDGSGHLDEDDIAVIAEQVTDAEPSVASGDFETSMMSGSSGGNAKFRMRKLNQHARNVRRGTQNILSQSTNVDPVGSRGLLRNSRYQNASLAGRLYRTSGMSQRVSGLSGMFSGGMRTPSSRRSSHAPMSPPDTPAVVVAGGSDAWPDTPAIPESPEPPFGRQERG